MFGGATIGSYLFLGFILVLCKAQNQNLLYNIHDVDVQTNTFTEESLQCYDCNSEYDRRCGDPFDPYTIGIVNCSQKKVPEHLRVWGNLKSNICRKTVQVVEGKTRVIRGCGYIRDSHDDKKCFRRTGTSQVEVIYCSCTSKLCNTGQSVHRPLFTIIVFAIIGKLTITGILNGIL